MATTVLICVTGHLARAGIYNCLLPLPFLCSLCPQPAVVLCLWGDRDLHSQRVWDISSRTWLGRCSFPLALITGVGNPEPL